uniref:SCP domain-containing protein n=2 Tax=Meloidogyne incognita group TaxID=654580 RepID=A0A914M977_MELIC
MSNNLIISILILAIIYTVVNSLTVPEQNAVVDCINKYRSQLANGNTKNKNGGNFPSGKDILEVSYSKDLEKSAQGWANKCIFDHNGADLYSGGKFYGENLYLDGDFEHKNITQLMIDACNAWWGESTTDGVPPSWINNFLPTDNKENDEKFEAVGHWTQMAWAKTYQIGCALKVCHKPECTGNLIDCRYYPGGNGMGSAIYQQGKPASGCGKAGRSTKYSGLCKPDPNQNN